MVSSLDRRAPAPLCPYDGRLARSCLYDARLAPSCVCTGALARSFFIVPSPRSSTSVGQLSSAVASPGAAPRFHRVELARIVGRFSDQPIAKQRDLWLRGGRLWADDPVRPG